MDFSKHPDVLNFRASQAEMQKWYSNMDEDFNPVYPSRTETVRLPVQQVDAARHIAQSGLVASQVVQEVFAR